MSVQPFFDLPVEQWSGICALLDILMNVEKGELDSAHHDMALVVLTDGLSDEAELAVIDHCTDAAEGVVWLRSIIACCAPMPIALLVQQKLPIKEDV